jgi:hypothetical protein
MHCQCFHGLSFQSKHENSLLITHYSEYKHPKLCALNFDTIRQPIICLLIFLRRIYANQNIILIISHITDNSRM